MRSRDGSVGVTHLIGDVQRFGLLSAASIVERYIQAVDRAMDVQPGASSTPDRLESGWLVDLAARTAEAGTRALDTITSLVVDGVGSGRVPAQDRLELPATRAGSTSEGSLWVHNPASAPAAGVDLRSTPLVSPDGSTIPSEAVLLSRPHVAVVSAYGREEVRLRVEVPATQPPGEYHGLVLSPIAPSEPLALRLVVLGVGESPP